MPEICAIGTRTTNRALIHDCYRLGYLNGIVADITYGHGRFWRDYRPPNLIAFDIDRKCGVTVADFTALPLVDATIDTVVFDPPYKLNGTPTLDLDATYGVGTRTNTRDRRALIFRGLSEAFRVSRKYVLVKSQDQISSGKYQPLTFEIWAHARGIGAVLIDQLFVTGRREQPFNTRQLHARRDYSTLLVFAIDKRFEIRRDVLWT